MVEKNGRVQWPAEKRFAFTIFDDTDCATVDNVRLVYDFLLDHGIRTTKTVWPVRGAGQPVNGGATCEDPEYLAWLITIQNRGVELAFHNATYHTSDRTHTVLALERFYEKFGHYPRSMANHTSCGESIYWGENRLSGIHRALYTVLSRGKEWKRYTGEIEKHPNFWGDLCKSKIKFVRNFTYADVNTLSACPYMPYHDPDRPFVNYWFAATEGAGVEQFNQTLTEAAVDRLEEEGGLCILYTHFAFRFQEGRVLNAPFRKIVEYISRKNRWFAPVSDILDYLIEQRGSHTIAPSERRRIERRWLMHKIRVGST